MLLEKKHKKLDGKIESNWKKKDEFVQSVHIKKCLYTVNSSELCQQRFGKKSIKASKQ